MILPPIFILFAVDFVSSEEVCEKTDFKSCEASCKDRVIKLEQIEDFWKDTEKIFFIESSDRPFLSPRQSCSVESAVKNVKNAKGLSSKKSRNDSGFVKCNESLSTFITD